MRIPNRVAMIAAAAAATARQTSAGAATATATPPELVVVEAAPETPPSATDAAAASAPAVPEVPNANFLKSLSTLPSCPSWGDETDAPKEHASSACDPVDMKGRNAFLTESRHATQQRYVEVGYSVASIGTDKKTWICPDSEDDDGDDQGRRMNIAPSTSEETGIMGLRTRWVVRNSSSGPVSVGWLNPALSYAEVSPFDNTVSPPHADMRAVLLPGQFEVIDAHHGHVFHVRELKDDGGGGSESGGGGEQQLVPGRLLLKHRAGLTPVRNRADIDVGQCPPASSTPPPVLPGKTPQESHDLYTKGWSTTCNSLYADFANRVGCPVDVYFAGTSSISDDEEEQGGDGSSSLPSALRRINQGPPTCRESFSFHLGTDPNPKDYVTEWNSPVKSEGTHLSHRFVARLHHDPTVVVDEIVIRGDTVRDCPDRRRGVGAEGVRIEQANLLSSDAGIQVGANETQNSSSRYGEFIAVSSGGQLKLHKDNNATDEIISAFAILNATEHHQRLAARAGTV